MNWLADHWTVIGGIFGVIGTPLGFLFGRKKAMAETRITQTDAIKNMQAAYDGWVADDKERYAELKAEMALLKKEGYQQREEISAMRKQQQEERKEYQALLRKYTDLDKKYNSLKNAFDRLKKKYDDKVNQTSSDGG